MNNSDNLVHVNTFKPGSWYQDEHIGGFVRDDGSIEVWEEYGLSDADTDKYSVEVQNGDGYYDTDGKYISYNKE